MVEHRFCNPRMAVRFCHGAPKYAGRQDKGRPAAFQAEDRGVRLSLPAPNYIALDFWARSSPFQGD